MHVQHALGPNNLGILDPTWIATHTPHGLGMYRQWVSQCHPHTHTHSHTRWCQT
jgi:hypothetical protein